MSVERGYFPRWRTLSAFIVLSEGAGEVIPTVHWNSGAISRVGLSQFSVSDLKSYVSPCQSSGFL